MPGEDVHIGLGANLGDASATLAWAASQLLQHQGIALVAASSLYRSRPVDAPGPDFINAVLRASTALDPPRLLALLQEIESRAGRRRPYRNAPRTLDLDLLLYGARTIDTPALRIPHPRLHLRRFVLQPLFEIAPGLEVPGRGPVAALLGAVQEQVVDPLPGLARWIRVEASSAGPGSPLGPG